jgi:two-component system sensor histidine kinase RegB
VARPRARRSTRRWNKAVANLLNNAADAADDEIRVELDWDAAWLRLTVCDQGPGFAAQVLHRGGREALPASYGGAGIGLLLAFSAVERGGGRIVLDNPPVGGARACIELPRTDNLEETGK